MIASCYFSYIKRYVFNSRKSIMKPNGTIVIHVINMKNKPTDMPTCSVHDIDNIQTILRTYLYLT